MDNFLKFYKNKESKSLGPSGDCGICKSKLDDANRAYVKLECSHFFHRDCLDTRHQNLDAEIKDIEEQEDVLHEILDLDLEESDSQKEKETSKEKRLGIKLEQKKSELNIQSHQKSLSKHRCPVCNAIIGVNDEEQ
mmetsp:Transcript_92081/g.199037  ORF Transcript_92081/g.199037 Transcript_92081/m.199037 type:complete len:136 (+) Transcript_92081:720-1127(+)|eukprot:CAMPEP_0116948290 /NCGR_PEP_ID=MMETSP0467-20121206/38241_1 /TAXON_ID=283647 /ORGANISM="Mesodinium pulex, Strain SPMC105" /LENGTH=135 /DNA_ID=CAMNT_0004632727 /DNA_START=711 /DNA_END=1118 /DNA_ORIENTATION=+